MSRIIWNKHYLGTKLMHIDGVAVAEVAPTGGGRWRLIRAGHAPKVYGDESEAVEMAESWGNLVAAEDVKPLWRPGERRLAFVIDIDEQFLRDQVVGSGISYWSRFLEWGAPGELPIAVAELSDDGESTTKRELCWGRAVQLAIIRHPKLLDRTQMDASTGDMWVQLAAFGEVKYG